MNTQSVLCAIVFDIGGSSIHTEYSIDINTRYSDAAADADAL